MKKFKIQKNKEKYIINNKQGGQAMLVAVVFFIFISLLTISGLLSPSVRLFKISGDAINSRQSFFLSESGVEDAYYRLISNLPINPPSNTLTLTLNNNTATTDIVDNLSGGKTITSTGDVSLSQRKSEIIVSTGTGVSFYYGVQTGQGGVYLDDGVINGNLYANGPVTASVSANNRITGTAISANSPALIADQINGSGVNPPYSVSFANNKNNQDIAQSFQVATTSPLNKVELLIKKQGNPNNAKIRIVDDNLGKPGPNTLAKGTLYSSLITSSYSWTEVSFNANPLLVVGNTYWLVVDANHYSGSKYYTIGANLNGYPNGIGKIGKYDDDDDSVWNDTSPQGLDYFFKIYLGGFTGLIDGFSPTKPLYIGTSSGTAQANTVNNVNSTGLIYCKNGTGNNQPCTNQNDPTYIAFPVSDANIAQWKSDASAGGVYNGNYNVDLSGDTLGPIKIVGDLKVSGGGTLNVTGTIWATGKIEVTGGSVMQLDSSYGANDGIVIADDKIKITGNSQANGSGNPESYMMLLGTNPSTEDAVEIKGGSGSVIVYSPNGTIKISGGASVQEAVGYKLKVIGGSSITYQSGLANSSFSSGPSGGWSITSWSGME